MSDSSIALKPVIEEPSKPMPPSKASSSSSLLIEKLLSWPRTSVNQSRMKRISRSSTIALTSSAVFGWSAIDEPRCSGWRNPNEAPLDGRSRSFGPSVARVGGEPLAAPLLERADRRLERLALLGERVLHADGRAVEHTALDDALCLQLLEALGEEAVGQLGDEVPDAAEVQRAVE